MNNSIQQLTQISTTIEEFLLKIKSSQFVHCFRSGGGLRVLRTKSMSDKINKNNDRYGEAEAFPNALRIFADDIKAGGRKYKDVYGKLEDHYLTGQSNPIDEFDAWLVRGHTIDFGHKVNHFWVELVGLEELNVPADIIKQVTNDGNSVVWSERGFTFESYRQYVGKNPGCSTRIIESPRNVSQSRAWMWYAARRVEDQTLVGAFEKVLTSPKIEIIDT